MSMKKIMLIVGFVLVAVVAKSQDSYIVKTNNVKLTEKTATTTNDAAAEQEQKKEQEDFVGKNFKYRSLCNWVEGMKFMVMPEKYDMIVNTFRDAVTRKEVSSSRLRHKIMIYRNHTSELDGSERINFFCPDENKSYYYEVPSGTFDDYCYGKMGVPTLAYLGDVDLAREKLMNAVLYTNATLYRIDVGENGDSYEEVIVPKNRRVKVKAIGVGTRSFPVKIIVEDEKGRQFYQNVAISRTNSGLRDDEFIMDNVKFTFDGSFRLTDATLLETEAYAKYIGREVYTRYATKMVNAKGETVNILRLSSFKITDIVAQSNTNYVKVTVQSLRTGEVFDKQVTFVNENVAGDIDGQREDYYGYLFIEGRPNFKGVSDANRELIHQGRIRKGFTMNEVRMALGEPTHTASSSSGQVDWIYNADGQAKRIVHFNIQDRVIGVSGF